MRPPRPNAYRDTWCGSPTLQAVGQRARVAGWVHRRRDHGGLIFIDLRDRTGLLQLVFRPGEAPDAHEQAGRSVKGQFKHADRIGARATVIVGDKIEVRDMDSGEQRPAADAAEVLRLVTE